MANNVLAYGFNSLSQMLSLRPSQVGVQLITTAIEESAAENTRAKNALLALLVERTTVAKESFALPTGGSLQRLDEFGVPRVVVPTGSYDVAYPIDGAGTAFGRNRVTAALETVADINRDQLMAQEQDADWLTRHLLAALLDNATWTYPDAQLGSLTIQPLANNDSVTFLRNGGTSSAANHYVAQTAAIADATNPFATIYTTLTAYPSNNGRRLISFIASNLVTTTQALTAFVDVDDPDIRRGANADTLAASGAGVQGPGTQVLGKVNNQWIVEWPRLPSSYILSVVEGRPPVAMREYPDPRLQGFFPEVHSPDGARIERRYLRYCGFGVRNRISAMVTQVSGGDTTYDIPTGYDAPLVA